MPIFKPLVSVVSLLAFLSCSHSQKDELSPAATSETDSERAPASLVDDRFPARSIFRLLVKNYYREPFSPYEDVVKSAQQMNPGVLDLAEALAANSSKAMVPLVALATGFKLASDETLIQTLSKMVGALAVDTLRDVGNRAKTSGRDAFPITHHAYLIPWQEDEPDLYYGENKVSLNAKNWAPIDASFAGEAGFEQKVSRDLRSYQNFMATNPMANTYLLGVESKLTIKDPDVSRLEFVAVLGLKPQQLPFDDGDDTVHFHKLVIPEIPNPARPGFPGNGPVVVISLGYDIQQANPNPPAIAIELGHLEGYQNGKFVLRSQGQAKEIPRLEGNLKSAWALKAAINIGIKGIELDLSSLRARKGQTLTSTRANLWFKERILGGYQIGRVNKEFENNVNYEIKANVKKAEEQLESKRKELDANLGDPMIVKALFERIL